ncbi:MAG: hypothetical protein RR034_07470, partial [Bacteroidales bacterium]
MINGVAFKINVDEYIKRALQEDITGEDVSTNAVMHQAVQGQVDLICKEDGILCGLSVFERVFQLLDEKTILETSYKDGDTATKGSKIGVVRGDIRVLL